jgi:hypothetical protein
MTAIYHACIDLPVRCGTSADDVTFESIQVALSFSVSGEEVTVNAARQVAGFALDTEFVSLRERVGNWVQEGTGYDQLLAFAEGER